MTSSFYYYAPSWLAFINSFLDTPLKLGWIPIKWLILEFIQSTSYWSWSVKFGWPGSQLRSINAFQDHANTSKFSLFSEFTQLSNPWRRTLKWPISIPSDFWEFSLKDLNGIFKSEISLKAFLTFQSHVIRICLQENTFGSNPRQNIFEEKNQMQSNRLICRPILFTCETNIIERNKGFDCCGWFVADWS